MEGTVPAFFEIYNGDDGIRFRLIVENVVVLDSCRGYAVVCDGERAIDSVRKSVINQQRLSCDKSGRLRVLSSNGRVLACAPATFPTDAFDLKTAIARCAPHAPLHDSRPNRRAAPGACTTS
jgi:hypothetical protein